MMKLLRSIFLVDLLKGMWLTLKYTPQPAFTFQYPAERRPVAPRFRQYSTRVASDWHSLGALTARRSPHLAAWRSEVAIRMMINATLTIMR